MTGLRRQVRHYRERSVAFVHYQPSTRPGALLPRYDDFDAIYLVGDPFTTETLGKWLADELPAGWTHGAHYLPQPNPVLRYQHEGGRTLEVHRAAAYLGEGTYTPRAAAAAWDRLADLIERAFDDGHVLATPATTGRYLLGRTIPAGREWPVLELETQDFLRATSGQGRVQVFDHAGAATLISQYDGRFMYAALCDGLPAGEPVRDTVNKYAGYYRPGRYLVQFRVPPDWGRDCRCGVAGGHAGIGILPVKGADRWEWPADPGATGTSWCSHHELHLAILHGWGITILERLLYPAPPYPAVMRFTGQPTRRGPLDLWAQILVRLRAQRARGADDVVEELVDHALRAILVDGIGALHGTRRRLTHVVSRELAEGGAIPRHAVEVRPLADGRLIWTEDSPHTWPEMSHPEWTTAIWGHARARLLSAPAGDRVRVGALHVPDWQVVAMFTDSIWVTGHVGWPDDGKVGRFRPVWEHEAAEPFDVPRTGAALRRLKWEQSRGA